MRNKEICFLIQPKTTIYSFNVIPKLDAKKHCKINF